jgi:hypothetical protein
MSLKISVAETEASDSIDRIMVSKRLTSPFLQAVPDNISEFDAFIYAVVDRKKDKIVEGETFGKDVRIDPAILRLNQGLIIAIIPKNINLGIESVEDLQDDWFESLEAAFLKLILSCMPR